MKVVSIIILLLIAEIICGNGNVNKGKSYDGYSVWKAKPNDVRGLKYLHDLLINGSTTDLTFDFWHFPSKVGNVAEIMVDRKSLTKFQTQCKLNNVTLNLHVENVDKLIQNQTRQRPKLRILQELRSYDFTVYPTLEEIEFFIKSLPNLYPDFVQLQELATTYNNRKQYLVKITNKATDLNLTKPAIWIDGGIHAREWISPVTVLYTLNKLLTEYKTADRNLKKYVDNLVWYFLPVMNPDGYAYTSVDRMWRKNRRPATCTTAGQCCQGVDLNRNFAYFWAASGASPQSCSEIYQGPSAFSEPESKGVRDFLLANKNEIKVFLSVHSFGQLWMIPFGAASNSRSPDYNELLSLANKAAQALQEEYGTVYKVGNSAEISYLASGTSSDWAKAVANIKYSYTVELRPGSGSPGGTFLLSADQILPSGQETWRAFRAIANEIMLNQPATFKRKAQDTMRYG